jgi:hypothetical protein
LDFRAVLAKTEGFSCACISPGAHLDFDGFISCAWAYAGLVVGGGYLDTVVSFRPVLSRSIRVSGCHARTTENKSKEKKRGLRALWPAKRRLNLYFYLRM